VSDRVAFVAELEALGATTLVSTTSAANRSDFGELPSVMDALLMASD